MKKLFILLITITILLTACQPTPTEEIVASKDKCSYRYGNPNDKSIDKYYN